LILFSARGWTLVHPTCLPNEGKYKQRVSTSCTNNTSPVPAAAALVSNAHTGRAALRRRDRMGSSHSAARRPGSFRRSRSSNFNATANSNNDRRQQLHSNNSNRQLQQHGNQYNASSSYLAVSPSEEPSGSFHDSGGSGTSNFGDTALLVATLPSLREEEDGSGAAGANPQGDNNVVVGNQWDPPAEAAHAEDDGAVTAQLTATASFAMRSSSSSSSPRAAAVLRGTHA
jgi:hypothetical protein